MILQVKNDQKKYKVKKFKELIDKAANAVIEREKINNFFVENDIEPVLSVVITDNDGIKNLNREFRGINESTDVLSFPLFEAGGKVLEALSEKDVFYGDKGRKEAHLGDLVISLEKAHEKNHDVESEIIMLTIHGVMHILGYDHSEEKEEKEMFKKQNKLTEKIILENREVV